jgi:diguanylate cyclase (GGDEF)-like protein/PAS domain S-box-containing protein
MPPLRPNSTKNILRLGFTVILGLMFLVASVSLNMLHTSSQRTKDLVLQNNTKADLIHEMRVAGRERIINLQNMLVLEDPFRQDEEWILLNQRGADFAAARLRLMELELTPAEQHLLEEQSRLTGVVGQLHLDIAKLILDGKKDAAHALLEREAIPRQHQAFTLLAELLDMQSRAGAVAVAEAEADYRKSVITTLSLMFGITGLILLIAYFLIRRTTETEEFLHATNEHAQVTLHSIGDGVITTNAQGEVEQMNPEAERLTGWSAADAVGQPLTGVFTAVHEETNEASADPIRKCLQEQQVLASSANVMLHDRDGHAFAIEYTAAPIFNRNHDRVIGLILVFRDVTQIRLISSELAYQAKHDMLTGLMNRHAFEQRLEKAIGVTQVQAGSPNWLCYLDLDQFKLINDTCGHLAGDELLKQVARILQGLIREFDLLARMGGDEFAVLLHRCPAQAAMQVVERMRQALAAMRFEWQHRQFTISGSFGLVPILPENETLYEVLSTADAACYVAKGEGRNRIHVCQGEDDAAALHTGEMHWVQRIKEALEQDRLTLYHQPIAALCEQSFNVHTEILVRLLDEDGALVPPMSFIPAAERYNLMAEIDRWVIRETFSRLRSHMMCAASGSCCIAINLSGQSLCDDRFLSFVLEQFDIHHVNPRHICFEITETCAIANLSRAIHFISTLRKRGCCFALDDFGSGLSSFGYLKNLPVDYLKIDGSFVRDIEHDPMALAMVDSINQIGHVAGMRIIAEYVENTAIRERLQALGVDYAQGYGVARPEPLERLAEWMAALPDAIKARKKILAN